jgi:hypothetical protein
MQVNLRIAGTTLDGMLATGTAAMEDFFGETPYTFNFSYIQADQDNFVDGKPQRFQADIQATTDTA